MSDAIQKFLDKDLADDYIDVFFTGNELIALNRVRAREPEMCWKCMGDITNRGRVDDTILYTCDDCDWAYNWNPDVFLECSCGRSYRNLGSKNCPYCGHRRQI